MVYPPSDQLPHLSEEDQVAASATPAVVATAAIAVRQTTKERNNLCIIPSFPGIVARCGFLETSSNRFDTESWSMAAKEPDEHDDRRATPRTSSSSPAHPPDGR